MYRDEGIFVNAQLPVSWYLINSTNKFYITINGITTTYYFMNGNYNVNTFIVQFLLQLGIGWTLTYNSITHKFLFGYTSNFTISDDINSLLPIIGFNSGSSNTSNNLFLSSVYPFNFGGITRLNIKSSTFNLNNVDRKNKGINRTIASIPVSLNQS